MKNIIRVGMAGLDTSHVPAFAELLHDPSKEHHVPGARIVAAFPGGSEDFDLSINRVGQFTGELRDKHGVEIVDSLGALRGKCDALMLESIDGRVHLGQFREVAGWGLPVFIDKPLTISAQEAQEIVRIAQEKNVRVTSASAIRFGQKFQEALTAEAGEPVTGADCYGPLAFQQQCPGYFWYGIHAAEMLFAALGTGCREVLAVREESHDIVVGRWADGRLGTLRGNRTGNNTFGGILHRKASSTAFDLSKGKKPYYASLLEKVIPFFRGETEIVALPEAVEVIRFLESANESVSTGAWVTLS
jgi:hypothetical protein